MDNGTEGPADPGSGSSAARSVQLLPTDGRGVPVQVLEVAENELARLGLHAAGWTLDRIEPQNRFGVLVRLRSAAGRTVRLEWYEHGGPPRDAFARGPLYAASWYDADPDGEPEAAMFDLCRALAEVGIPRLITDLDRLQTDSAPELLQFTLEGPCGQTCSFCCHPRATREAPGGTEPLERFEHDLRRHAEAGTRGLRINGIEPLTAPDFFPILALARKHGYRRLELLSSCRPLADRRVFERFVTEAPEEWVVFVPLYGPDARIHDAVVGRRGAFDDVMAALDNLLPLRDAAHDVRLSTVIVNQNVHALAELGALARRLDLPLKLHLPHHMGLLAEEVYPRCVLPMSEVVRAIFPPGEPPPGDFAMGRMPLCIELVHHRDTGAVPYDPVRVIGRTPVPEGAHYAVANLGPLWDTGFFATENSLVRCPHAETCEVSSACTAFLYPLYYRQFGVDELVPFTRAEVAALPGTEWLLRAIDGDAPAIAFKAPAMRAEDRNRPA